MVEANNTGLSPRMANLMMAQRKAVGGGSRNRPRSGSNKKIKKHSAARNDADNDSQGSNNSGIRGINVRRDSSAAPIHRLGNAEEVFKIIPGIKSPRGHRNFYDEDEET